MTVFAFSCPKTDAQPVGGRVGGRAHGENDAVTADHANRDAFDTGEERTALVAVDRATDGEAIGALPSPRGPAGPLLRAIPSAGRADFVIDAVNEGDNVPDDAQMSVAVGVGGFQATVVTAVAVLVVNAIHKARDIVDDGAHFVAV